MNSEGGPRVETTSRICTNTSVCCFYVVNALIGNGVRHDAHVYS